jgi:hypothetical protein
MNQLPNEPSNTPSDASASTLAAKLNLLDSLQATKKKSIRKRRNWSLTLGTAEVWRQDPAFAELAEMVLRLSGANNKINAKNEIGEMRIKAQALRERVPPLTASALVKVIRRTEAACGAVLDKGARVQELQASWDHFLACLQSKQDPPLA